MPLKNKISVQFMDVGSVDEMAGVIEALNPTVVKFCFTDPAVVIQVMQRFPDLLGVYRMWWEAHIGNSNQFHVLADYIRSRHGGQFDAQDAVDEWMKVVRGGLDPILHAPGEVRARLWIEGINETNDHKARGNEALYQFEERRCKTLEGWGLRAACISSGVGWEHDFEGMRRVGLLDTMQTGGHWFSTHGYGDKLMNVKHGFMSPVDSHGTLAHPWPYYRQNRQVEAADMLNTWLAFRCAREQFQLQQMGYSIIQVITETGLDAAAEDLTQRGDSGAIKSAEAFLREKGLLTPDMSLAQYYAEELLYAELQYRVYPNVIGACIFSYGGAGWPSFDIRGWGVIDHLSALLRQHPRENTPPPPPPLPEGCYVQLAEKTPAGSELVKLNIRQKPYVVTGNIIGVLERGIVLQATARADVNGVTWIRVKLQDGQPGWVHGGYVKQTCVNAELPTIEAPPLNEDTPPTVEELTEKIHALEQTIEELRTIMNRLEQKIVQAIAALETV